MTLPKTAKVHEPQSPEQAAFLAQFLEAARRSNPSFALLPFDVPYVLRLQGQLKKEPAALEAVSQLALFMNARDVCNAILKDPSLLKDLADKGIASDIAMELLWAYLGNEKRSTLLRLAVFPSAFSRESAETAATVAFSQLVQLASKSVLLRKGAARYEVNGLLRTFIERKLAAQPALAQSMRKAHAKHFLEKLTELAELDHADEEDEKKLKAMRGQALDLTQACAVAFPTLGSEAADAYLAALNKVLRRMGRYLELASFLEATTRSLQASGAKREGAAALALWARLTACLGGAELHLGKPVDSLLRLLTAAREARALGHQALLQDVLDDLATYAVRFGRVSDIRPVFQERLADCRAAKDTAGEALALLQLGRLEDSQGNSASTWKALEPAMELFERLGQEQRSAECLGLMAERSMKDGKYQEAKAWGLRFLEKAGRAQDRQGLIWSQQRLADVELLTGELDSAEARLRQSLILTNSLGEQSHWAYFHTKVGEALRLAGRLDESIKLTRIALEAYHSMRDAWGEAWSASFLGHALYLAGQVEEAKKLLHSSAESLRTQQNAATLAPCLTHLGELRLSLEGPQAAWEDLREGLRLAIVGGYAHVQMELLAAMAACLHAAKHPLGAELAAYLPLQPACTYAGKALLKRWKVAPAPKLQALAGPRKQGLDLPSVARLLLRMEL